MDKIPIPAVQQKIEQKIRRILKNSNYVRLRVGYSIIDPYERINPWQ